MRYTSLKSLVHALRMTCWTLLSLALIDVAVGWLFSRDVSAGPRQLSGLERYFEFGRSTQGKIAVAVGPTPAVTDPEYADFLGGCLTDEAVAGLPREPEPSDESLVAIYGMSFSANIARALEKIAPHVTVRSLAAPSAPPSHAFARYEFDRSRHKADTVVLSLLAGSVPYTLTMTGMTWGVEQPFPYMYPRYELRDDRLCRVEPLMATPADLRQAVSRPLLWDPFIEQLRAYDRFYSPLVFRATWADRSITLRLLRRAYAQHRVRSISSAIHTTDGFDPASETARVLEALVTQFARTARDDGRLPIVLLVQEQGYGDHLYRLLEPVLASESIPHVSTHTICPASEPSNFVPDGHFTAEGSERIAREILRLVDVRIAQRRAAQSLPGPQMTQRGSPSRPSEF